MNNDQAKKYFAQGLALYQTRDYDTALEEFETALGLVESWDTQFRENILYMIENMKELKKLKAKGDYAEAMARKFRNA